MLLASKFTYPVTLTQLFNDCPVLTPMCALLNR